MLLESDEEASLLRNLLDEGQSKRQLIALDLHAKKTLLAVINNDLKVLGLSGNLAKTDIGVIKKLISMTSQVYKDIGTIDKLLFPKTAFHLGFCGGLKGFLRETIIQHKVFIDYSEEVPDPLSNDKMREVTVFLACVEIIEYLLLIRKKKIKIELKAKNKQLEISISAAKLTKRPKKNLALEKKLKTIKGMLVRLTAFDLPGMNNSTVFKFSVPFN